MTRPMPLAEFTRLPPATRAVALDGLAGAIDRVAQSGPAPRRFLRYQWFAAALAAYGGAARTILIEQDGDPVVALPLVRFGPGAARMAAVPGSYWPLRSFPATDMADAGAFDALAVALAGEINVLRVGPVPDGDGAVAALVAAARARGWVVLDRVVGTGWVLDLADPAWPRGSSLRKNRFHERHLAAHGALGWRFLDGAALADGGFDALAAVEQKSWIAARTDGRDAKFTRGGHGAFWRAAAQDAVLAGMMSAAVLEVNGAPAAFSFDLDGGALRYAVANSYDPAFARHSPGKLLCYRNLARARADGITTVDWGSGDSGYKQTLGAVAGAAIRDWLLLRPGIPALLGGALRTMWARGAG